MPKLRAMVSLGKRSEYVTDSETSSGEELDSFPAYKRGRLEMNSFSQVKVADDFDERKPKCSNRNALLARENRRKKKLYIQSLEDEVLKLRDDKKKLNSILDNQSFVIQELRKEIKYVKSVLANSSDIGKLIKNIRSSTGMSVATSLDKTLTLNNDCVSKQMHPWEDKSLDLSPCNSSFDDFTNLVDFPFDDIPLLDFGDDKNQLKVEPERSPLSEHSYTNISNNPEDDVGVCLHVSKHRVSLEFCSSCSENAVNTWKEVEQED